VSELPVPLVDVAEGRPAGELFETLYARLKELASEQLARGRRGTLDTTTLVHELYLRLDGGRALAFEHPVKFFSYAARAMRHLLIDRARDRLSQKAGGDWARITLTGSDDILPAIESAERALVFEQALERLEQVDARAARVVELRWFAGLPPDRIAEMMQLTRRTIDRDWRFARVFLYALMQ
jgi:RNA polymerase sigma factor (TIGR02999 family)